MILISSLNARFDYQNQWVDFCWYMFVCVFLRNSEFCFVFQNNRVASLFTVGCINEQKISQSRRCTVVHNTLNEIRDEAYKSLLEFNKSTNEEEW